MVFASITFLLFYLPLVIAGYFLLPARGRNYWLVSVSVLFYFWGGGVKDTLVLLGVATIDFFMAHWIARSKRRKFVFTFSIIWNLALLSYFKYAGFFYDSAVGTYSFLTGSTHLESVAAPGWARIALPLGISFFIFETISYITDIYRGKLQPAKRLSDYAMYLTFFPHLVAGPIYRYADIVDDIDPVERSKKISSNSVLLGTFLFALGLAKKCLIANPLARLADFSFSTPQLSSGEAWSGILAYTFQIYFDFSGYSSMAIGLALIFGFTFPENFNEPYCATSVTDFWRRWHMTLSHWFKDYLYIPLGGNQRGNLITYRNLMIVFFLCGLWHGAAWNFVVWGVYHGVFLVLERMGASPLSWKLVREKCPVVVPRLLCFLIVLGGWVLFRAESYGQAVEYFKAMSPLNAVQSRQSFRILIGETYEYMLIFPLAMLSLISFERVYSALVRENEYIKTKVALSLVFLLYCVSDLATTTFNPFIYFRF